MVNVKIVNRYIFDIETNYLFLIDLNPSIKLDLIYPATDKHILKFMSQPLYLVQETEEIYQTITLPHILESSLSLQVCFILKFLDNTYFIII